jgi:hypothetical protein
VYAVWIFILAVFLSSLISVLALLVAMVFNG